LKRAEDQLFRAKEANNALKAQTEDAKAKLADLEIRLQSAWDVKRQGRSDAMAMLDQIEKGNEATE